MQLHGLPYLIHHWGMGDWVSAPALDLLNRMFKYVPRDRLSTQELLDRLPQ